MDESHPHQPASWLPSGVAPPPISFRQLAPAPCLSQRQQAWPCSPCATPVSNNSGTSLQHTSASSHPINPNTPNTQCSGSSRSATTSRFISPPVLWCEEPPTYEDDDPSRAVTAPRPTGAQSLPILPSQLRQPVRSLHPRQVSADQVSQRQPLHNIATKLRGRGGAIDLVETGKPECACEVCRDPRCGYKPARNLAPDDRPHALKLQRLHALYKKRKSKAEIRCDILGCNQVILNGRTDNLKEHKKSSRCAGFGRAAWGEPGTGAAQQRAEELTSEEELRLVEAKLEEAWLDAVLAAIKRQDDAGLFAGSPPYPAVDLMPMMDFERLVDADHFIGIPWPW
ncbi:hypothetical protein B0T14DRAFT_247269 [Immersiella caudata]|uniref:Uncharacterized protein n=1 Tax=Immersiella caudata TaxID=314043 RepID=A0AA39WJA9_9PEZI|nr:hypothetical protein B0T14DRAFT_247269 [Immersiella caudata]